MSVSSVRCALGRCETRYAPDGRVACFEVKARQTSEGISLRGTVQSEWLRKRAVTAAEQVARNSIDATDLDIIEEVERPATVTTAIVPVRGRPDPDAERVTETLYGAAITTFDERRAWTRARTPDGYLGWIRTEHLAVPVEGSFEHVLSTDVAGLIDGPGPETVYAGTECDLYSDDSNEIIIRFRTGIETQLPAGTTDVSNPSLSPGSEPREIVNAEEIVTYARRYLGTPYRWGGITTEGIDCSGLVWMAYRLAGYTLPRDADQQQQVGIHVSREELKPGDLLFFPGHVALSLGGTEYIHADGETNAVVTASLDPAREESNDKDKDDRDEDKDGREYEMAKRLLQSSLS